MPYLIARALIDGKVMLETFTDEAVRNKDVLQLLDRVEMKVDPKLQSAADGSQLQIATWPKLSAPQPSAVTRSDSGHRTGRCCRKYRMVKSRPVKACIGQDRGR